MTTTSPLRKLIASFGFEYDPSNAIVAQRTISGVTGALGKLATVGAGLVLFRLAREFAHFAIENVEAAKKVGDTSNKLGIAAQKLELLQQAAEENGATAENLTIALRRLAVAAEGIGKNAALPFKQLGVAVKDAHGKVKPLDQLFQEVGIALSSVTNSTDRAALAQKVFGRSGTELLGVFSRGKEGTKAYFEELQKLTGGYSDEFVKAADDAVVAQKRFEFTFKGLKSQIIVAFLPAITFLIQKLTQVVSWFTDLFKWTHFLQAGFIILGAKFAQVFGRILLPILGRVLLVLAPIIAKFVFFQLVLDDLITFLTGGESVIGAFLDALFGVGTAIKVCKELNAIWDDFTNVVIPGAIVAVQDLWAAITQTFKDLGDWLSSTWGLWLATWHEFVDGLPEPVKTAFEAIEKFLIDKVNAFFGLFDDFFSWLGKKFDLFGVLDDAANAAARAEARARDASPKEAAQAAKRAGVSLKEFRKGAVDTFGGFHPAVVGAPTAAGQAAAAVVRVPAPTAPVVNQVNNVNMPIDARGAKDPKGVVKAGADALRGVHRDSRNAALRALELKP